MPSEPPRVWKNEPGARGGRYWVTSGENVSASSTMIASVRQAGRQGLHELRGVERDAGACLGVGVARGHVAPGRGPRAGR